jgi:hypothetical protein
MERSKSSISPDALYARLGSEAAPIIVDVRRDADFSCADRLMAEAVRCSPDSVEVERPRAGTCSRPSPANRLMDQHRRGNLMIRSFAIALLMLAGVAANDATQAQSSCKVCSEQQAACMKNYAGPTCKSEYKMCMKSCGKKS